MCLGPYISEFFGDIYFFKQSNKWHISSNLEMYSFNDLQLSCGWARYPVGREKCGARPRWRRGPRLTRGRLVLASKDSHISQIIRPRDMKEAPKCRTDAYLVNHIDIKYIYIHLHIHVYILPQPPARPVEVAPADFPCLFCATSEQI